METLRRCAGALAWLLGCGPTHSEAYLAAEACFLPDELAAVRQQYHARVLDNYSHGLDQQHFLEWCGLAGAPPVLADALFAAVQCCSDDCRDEDADGGGEGGAQEEAAALTGGGGGGRYSGGSPDLDGRGGGTGSGGGSRGRASVVSLEDIVVAKAQCERMDDAAAAGFAFAVLDPGGSGFVGRDRLAAVIEALLALSLPPSTPAAAPAASAQAIAAGALALAASASSAAPPGCLDLEGFQKWSARVSAPKALLTGLLANIGAPGSDPHQHTGPGEAATGAAAVVAPGHTPSSPHPAAAHVAASAPQGGPPLKLGLPALVTGAPQPAPPRDGLLQPEWVWLLAPGLAPALRQEWRLLFSSDRHGASFNTFLARLGEAAPTLVLVRDHGGALFGGVAHAPWRRSGTFFGDYANKLVSLLPAACVYPASGINANLQWSGSHFEQLPNGVGFGGQQGNFGLWIDASFDTGHSRPNATYASPSLSVEQNFHLDAVEAWLLQPPEEDEEEERRRNAGAKGRGVLNQSQEDQRLLELAGVAKNYRGAIPDEPLEEG